MNVLQVNLTVLANCLDREQEAKVKGRDFCLNLPRFRSGSKFIHSFNESEHPRTLVGSPGPGAVLITQIDPALAFFGT